MTEKYLINKVIKYLTSQKKKAKNKNELIELKQMIEELDSLNYKIKEWKER